MAGVRHFTDLITWQLADQLRAEVFKLTARPPMCLDFKMRAQMDDAADSICRNIAEGFGGTNREFAHFLRIARRSMNELQDGFRSATLKEYVTDEELQPARQLQRRLYPALAALLSYLDRHNDGRPE